MMTPIQYLKEEQGNSLYIKREDLLPFSFGGNKARKAELFFSEIKTGQHDYVVTYGGGSSNHCRVIANLAAVHGIPCIIISPLEIPEATWNTTLVQLFGGLILSCPVTEVHDKIEQQLVRLQAEGHRPYFIPGGGHGNLGTQAYVDCYDEIARYEAENCNKFDYIFLASGTGTTQAGLICGKLIGHRDTKIIGISIARMNPYGHNVVQNSVNAYMDALRCHEDYSSEIEFVDDYTCGGYGKYSAGVLDTVKELIYSFGIAMSTTYTGKAFWGMRQYIKAKDISGKRILFIHTGGVPLFFHDLEKLVT